jgi:hypothetical protein
MLVNGSLMQDGEWPSSGEHARLKSAIPAHARRLHFLPFATQPPPSQEKPVQ